MRAVSGKQMRKIEDSATENIGIPTLLLMENAAIRLAEHCLAYLNAQSTKQRTAKIKPKVIILAGIGGNGGDGLALARHLYLNDVDVRIVVAGDISSIQGDSYVNLNIVRNMGLTIHSIPSSESMMNNIPYMIESSDLVVDALFGAGLNRQIAGNYKSIVDTINNCSSYVISVDVPSGICADTGQVLGSSVKADLTVTLGFPKIGIMLHPGASYAGEINIADISLPNLSTNDPETSIYTDKEIPAIIPTRPPRSNKGSFGRVFAFVGSSGMPGAAVLSATAAYKAGAGYVYACVIPPVAQVLQNNLKETVTYIVPEYDGYYCKESFDAIADDLNKSDVIMIGPGIGHKPHISEFVFRLIETAESSLVIDADALNAVSEDVNILKKLKAPCVITPHPGEMSRLTGLSISNILNNTIQTANDFSHEYGVITLLKDARTIVADPNGQNYINVSGSSALAKAGSGDVLTGIIASFIAQGLDPFTAAKLGAYVHGKAGELAGKELSNYGVLASDLLDHIPKILKYFQTSQD